MKTRHLLKKIQETLHTGQWRLSPLQSGHLGTSHRSPSITGNSALCPSCSCSGSYRTNFARTRFVPRSCVKISDTVDFGIPGSASSSHTVSCRSLLITAHARSTFSVFCSWRAFQNVDHFQQILNHLWIVCATLLFVLHWLHHPRKPSESSE